MASGIQANYSGGFDHECLMALFLVVKDMCRRDTGLVKQSQGRPSNDARGNQCYCETAHTSQILRDLTYTKQYDHIRYLGGCF